MKPKKLSKLEQDLKLRLAIDSAFKAAALATAEYLAANPTAWYPCGFAWVKLKPARGPLVNLLKDLKLGHVDSYFGGLMVYNPSMNSTQCMNAKIAGAEAFVKSLQESKVLGAVKAFTESRID